MHRSSPEPPDATLLKRTRNGDRHALGTLFDRHHRAALKVAGDASSFADAEDIVAEAYASITQAISRGAGPSQHFRAYLFASIRNAARADRVRDWKQKEAIAGSRLEAQSAPVSREKPSDHSVVRGAFDSLPTPAKRLLFRVEVLGEPVATAGRAAGLSPTAAAAALRRARLGLRENYLSAHTGVGRSAECDAVRAALTYQIRRGRPLSADKSILHLNRCDDCRQAYARLRVVNQNIA